MHGLSEIGELNVGRCGKIGIGESGSLAVIFELFVEIDLGIDVFGGFRLRVGVGKRFQIHFDSLMHFVVPGVHCLLIADSVDEHFTLIVGDGGALLEFVAHDPNFAFDLAIFVGRLPGAMLRSTGS